MKIEQEKFLTTYLPWTLGLGLTEASLNLVDFESICFFCLFFWKNEMPNEQYFQEDRNTIFFSIHSMVIYDFDQW